MTGIRDLARHLDISIGTVSRALNGKPDVNAETRHRVMEAAASLGYTPNQSGRSLRKGATGLLGIIVPSDPEQTLVDAVFASVLDGLRRFIATQGLDLAIFLYSQDEDPHAVLRRVAERRLVDALIITQTLRTDPRIDYLIKTSIPFVAFGRSRSGRDYPWVDMDFAAAVDAAVDRLARFGHEHFAVVVPDGGINYSHIIVEQSKAALSRHGLHLPQNCVLKRRHGQTGGYQAGSALLALKNRPTAVLTADRTSAVGLYKRLDEAGIRLGRDMAVLGLHCDSQAQFLSPTLSCYQSDLPFVGRELGRALLAAMTKTSVVQSVVPVTLKAGGSDSPPRPALRASRT